MRDAEQSALELGVRLDARMMLELGDLRLGSDVLGLHVLQRQQIALVLEFTAQGVIRNGIFNLPVGLRLLCLMPGHSRVLLLHLHQLTAWRGASPFRDRRLGYFVEHQVFVLELLLLRGAGHTALVHV